MKNLPVLWLIIPCYNESSVLPITAPSFCDKIKTLIDNNKIDPKSKILFVDDGSSDDTWEIIQNKSMENSIIQGIRQSRNRGHQNAVLAGLMEARAHCDITISIDCDGQDDINAIDEMVSEYQNGYEIVYGVRKDRSTDTWFKRSTAQFFYKFLNYMGVEAVYNHADYRLVSSTVLNEFVDFGEVNLFLRGMFPLVGFRSTSVYYDRKERIAGESHYPIKKMLALAVDGVTSLSIMPIRFVTGMGIIVSIVGFMAIIWAICRSLSGNTVQGWTSTVCMVCFLGGIQLLSLGIIGEYVGKAYMEIKKRPRYIISERTMGLNRKTEDE